MQALAIKSALISVYHKNNLDKVVSYLHQQKVTIYSTGGTQQFIEQMGVPVTPVEQLTDYPAIFGGRVKTLHPKIFGGILFRREVANDIQEAEQYQIPAIDLVIVDLYPFEQTVASGASEQEIIEKIDIGGVSLIRAAAKNFKHVGIVASPDHYQLLVEMLEAGNGTLSLDQRRTLATYAFDTTSHYDTAIFHYFNNLTNASQTYKQSIQQFQTLRYGENPHQQGVFYGQLAEMFEQLNGKELSYNNLVDVEAAVALAEEFESPACAIIKHTNACGAALGSDAKQAYLRALEADPVSAFGGVIALNRTVEQDLAEELDKLFFEVLIAPSFSPEALSLLTQKKNRILLRQLQPIPGNWQSKTILNGVLKQDKDLAKETADLLKPVTRLTPSPEEVEALLFAAIVCKHTKSNTIVLAKDNQLLASGVGQTSRVDALKQAIAKARHFGFALEGAVMASDAFFPFPDCVEIAHQAGIQAVIQPGGSIKDQASIDFCDQHQMKMVFTGIRHFKH
ncbi:MAG TPA: bifunctional phosphoribosylaminoimidazolecarboxamide formyltransferase/IMP cyclohydrolase PurH [Microscillaceae bacterium]|jgi:phosphoribosylaminoimidazolecarboxamide formyltransferase/IMP cyclohydrolase|nr:bifunctional phosphoribosylaminoimidazolecarboxamide formyltransferase/IMP cyclohydrolase PurH [Microscillaceae bacterium]